MANGGDDKEVSNKQVIFKDYVAGFYKESDMYVSNNSTLKLKVPVGSSGIVVKNLYLSCDPYILNRMRISMKPGSVSQRVSHYFQFCF